MCSSSLARELRDDLEAYFQGEKVEFSRYRVDFETCLGFVLGRVNGMALTYTESNLPSDRNLGSHLPLPCNRNFIGDIGSDTDTDTDTYAYTDNDIDNDTDNDTGKTDIPPINFGREIGRFSLGSRSIEILNELRKTPYGEVLTYGKLAQKVGSGPRAIGQVMKRNPLPVIVPCHRVVAKRGLGGYNQGITIKKKLLELECVL